MGAVEAHRYPRTMEAVIFDLFGTLVPNLSPDRFTAAATRIAELFGVPLKRVVEEIKSQFPQRMSGAILDGPLQFVPLAAALGVAVAETDQHAAYSVWVDFQVAGLTPKPDALHVLEALRERGYALALASDCSSGTPARLDATAMGAFFSVRACSALIGEQKPHAAMYEHVLSGLGVPGSECLYVGDGNSNELAGARRHGMTTVWVDNGRSRPDREVSSDADHRVTELTQILDLVH